MGKLKEKSKLSVNSNWKLKIVRRNKEKDKEKWEITCPMCGAVGKKNFRQVEDKSKIFSYVSIVPIYAKKYVCKRCGYEF